MSDSKDTNELDSYGVWVKTPPKTVDSSDTTQQASDTFSFDTDLPDFSDLDVIDSVSADSDYDNADTALSTEELFNITNDVENTDDFSSPAGTESPAQAAAANSNGEEEISLDEFIEGGVFETGPDEDKIKEKEEQSQENTPAQQPETTETAEDTVSFDDDFTVESDENENILPEEPVTEDTSSLSDDDIFNIDLSFEDDSSANSSEEKSIPQTEETAVNFDSPAGTEDVDLNEFGFDEDSAENTEATVTEPAVLDSNGGMENIDLSEFGFEDTDSAAEENVSEENNTSTENEAGTAEPDIEISQEEESPAVQSEVTDKEETVAVAQNEDDDFDLDSILGNITDENGNTSSLADFEEPVQTAAELQEEIKEPEVLDIPEEIPQEEVTDITEEAEEPELSDTLGDVIDDEPSVTEIEEIQKEEPLETPDSMEVDASCDEVQFEKENAETVNAKEVEIPDTFEEETSTFLEEDEEKANEFASSITAPVLSENELETEKPSAQMTAIFSQIVEELSSLKNEFASLKNEIETIKNQTKAPLPVQETEKEESHGFFADTDEDDTIALSTDELDNILQTADITQAEEQPVETEENEEPAVSEVTEEKPSETEEVLSEDLLGSAEEVTDFAEEDFEQEDDFSTTFENTDEDDDSAMSEIEEPVLDELDYSGLDSNSNLPEEISVPKADDILVESSSTDLLETSEVNENAEKIDEPYSFEELTAEEPSIAETLTEEKLDYLTSTPEENSLAQKTEDKTVEPLEETSELEDFNFEEETQNENLTSVETEESKEENPATAETDEVEKTENNELSGDLKTEIKSVLSYMDQLLENLPEDKIAEFAQSQQFDTYKKLFKELGLA